MSERMQLYRLIVRGIVTVIIALSLIVGMFLLVRELPDDPDTALVAILGTVLVVLLLPWAMWSTQYRPTQTGRVVTDEACLSN